MSGSKYEANDASLIPQPTYADLFDAYVAGALSARMYPSVTDIQIRKSADAWCKLFHAERDPVGFGSMGH
jgi:hypothetical protein